MKARVREFHRAWAAIALVRTNCDRDIADLEQKIAEIRAQAAAEIDNHNRVQAAAAAAIRAQRYTEEEVADLLDITVKQARQLITRDNRPSQARTPEPDPRKPRTRHRHTATSSGPDHGPEPASEGRGIIDSRGPTARAEPSAGEGGGIGASREPA
ncbi:hypothetical protein NDR87_13675 [Nocardia sp. CDC159]|uniref:Uncharacterized protein n=1 Tax=Nocardia pulmonis TaxID=2951408 RepID=A0A9X2E7C3_9NOCA|nr:MULTISPECIES: hypothetical protein [Nocardia]MCM6774528.1 hypothetical protein [Nocardia pulmonis]MCM6787406.1 hypothetical protein [Nocardia sp. CDC159]